MPATPFADLDTLLGRLVSGTRAALGDQLVGIYLQGSFALGAADIHSDVDLVTVIERDLASTQLEALQVMHGHLHRSPGPWATHLEGSYVPRVDIRRRGPRPVALPYLDNGADRLIQEPHCDSHVTRWIVRERGITLTGPPPVTLIDPVGPDQLRQEMDGVLVDLVRYASQPSPSGHMSRWMQAFVVSTLCRVLHTTSEGTVASKRAALEWARDRVGREWHDLIQKAIDDRPDPWRRVHEPADADLVDRTWAFAAWVAAHERRIPA